MTGPKPQAGIRVNGVRRSPSRTDETPPSCRQVASKRSAAHAIQVTLATPRRPASPLVRCGTGPGGEPEPGEDEQVPSDEEDGEREQRTILPHPDHHADDERPDTKGPEVPVPAQRGRGHRADLEPPATSHAPFTVRVATRGVPPAAGQRRDRSRVTGPPECQPREREEQGSDRGHGAETADERRLVERITPGDAVAGLQG